MKELNISTLKTMNEQQLTALADEIRSEIISATAKNGGHLASNLGAVELTIALHYCFNSPTDKLVFDVGHQTYTHKLLTGRSIDGLRTENGISGFPSPEESVHDIFAVGHSSTAISTALGLARARDLRGEKFNIIAIVGDGAIGGGMSFEAMNDLGGRKTPLIVILNDNEMSIARNVGAIAKHLVRLRTARGYVGFKRGMERFLLSIPLIGKPVFNLLLKIKNAIRSLLIGSTVFDLMGLKYIGMVHGHDLHSLIEILNRAKDEVVPVLIHVSTVKGRGMEAAEKNPEAYHGVSCSKQTGESFTAAFGRSLCAMAEENDKICAVTAGMPASTGLSGFKADFPERFFDVGIAEQHAIGLSAGLAKGGLLPFTAIYSTFLERCSDQIFEELCLQKLPCVLCVDRSGLTGEDGETHQGIFDIGFLRGLGMPIMAPADNEQLAEMMRFAVTLKEPSVIRYPKAVPPMFTLPSIKPFEWQTLRTGGTVAIVAFGAMLCVAMDAAGLIGECTVINACYINPIDERTASSLNSYSVVCVLEDNVRQGGLYEALLPFLDKPKVISCAVMLKKLPHTGIERQRILCGLDAKSVYQRIKSELK